MSDYTKYGLVLKDGSVVICDNSHWFRWEGHTYTIGTFGFFEDALRYMEMNPKGVWLTDEFGGMPKNEGRWIPFGDIVSVVRRE